MNIFENKTTDDSKIDEYIARRLCYTWQAFFERFGSLTEVQRLAIPKILENKNLLICSPTASGKTEAVCAPLVERNFRRDKWLILYVSPTRALINDLYERLSQPLSILGIGISRHTGDHHDKNQNTKILLTTPESFDSILCNGKIKQDKEVVDHRLSNVTALVLDEIHCIIGTPRGEHLLLLIERLKRLRIHSKNKGWGQDELLQIIVLSATISSPESVRERYLPKENSECLILKGGRNIDTVSVECEIPTTELALRKYISGLNEDEKLLVFSNTRKRVDFLAQNFKEHLAERGYKVFAHHGSLSKKLREEAEEAMKKEQRVVIFSSPTLEVGIDIGDIDLVVLDGPTADIQTLLQRIGRGNRRTDTTRVMCCSGSLAEVIIHSAMIESAKEGLIFGNLSGPCYAVARQQIASYIYQAKNSKRSKKHLLKFLETFIPLELGEELLRHLLEEKELREVEEQIALGEYWIQQTEMARIHSNIEGSYGVTVIDHDKGINIAGGINYYGGKLINIGGRLLKVQKWDGKKLEVREIRNCLTDPDAYWGYCSKAWLKGAGQQEAIRYYCNIPEDVFPEIILGDYRYVFHFGGTIRKIVLELIFEIYSRENYITVNEWYFKITPDLKNDWQKRDINTSLLKIRANEYLDKLEKALNRPYANRKLPVRLRLEEIYQWLTLEQEVEKIRTSIIMNIENDEVRDVLSIIIGEYEDVK